MENKELKFNNKLERSASWYRVLYAEVEKMDSRVGLSAICIYDENGIICKHNFGYFHNDYELEFNGKVVRKLKENFTSKENYILKEKKCYSWEDTTYILYIYKDNVNIEYKGLDKDLGNVYDVYSINGKTEIRVLLKNLETEVYAIRDLIEKETKKIKIYDLPLAESEMKQICDNLMKYNTMLIQEEEKIENYVPTAEDREGSVNNGNS